MCDCCPAPNSMLHIYTISIFTGERLNLCLECADARCEPLNSVIYGIQNGALQYLPKEQKINAKLWTNEGYWTIYQMARHLAKKAALPPPSPSEELGTLRLVHKIKEVTPETDLVHTNRRFWRATPEETPIEMGLVHRCLRRIQLVLAGTFSAIVAPFSYLGRLYSRCGGL